MHLSGQKSAVVEQKIVILLANLACYKHNKTMMMSNRELHKIALGLLSQHVSYAEQLVILVYNLIYKNAAGVKLYRRK